MPKKLIEYSIQDFALLEGVSAKTVYRWIKEKKVNSIQKRIDGVKKMFVTVDEDDSRKYEKVMLSHSREYLENDLIHSYDSPYSTTIDITSQKENGNIPVNSKDDINVIHRNLDINLVLKEIFEMKNELVQLSNKAGQVKLLEDFNKRQEEEYFRVTQENRQLHQKIGELEQTILSLKDQISHSEEDVEQLKQKISSDKPVKWWKIFVDPER